MRSSSMDQPEPDAMRQAGERPRRRVAVDWDELEIALTWRSDEWESFLDVRTGEVRRTRSLAFGDEPEEWGVAARALLAPWRQTIVPRPVAVRW